MNHEEYVLIAHPDKQHSYHTVMAFKNHEKKIKYITTIYNKKGSLTSFLNKLLPRYAGQKFAKYKSTNLEDDEVIQYEELLSLIVMFLGRIPCLNPLKEKLRVMLLCRFNRKIARVVCKTNPSILVTYDTLSGDALKMLTEMKTKTLLVVDMSAPYFPEMCRTYKSLLVTSNNDPKKNILNFLKSEIYKDRFRQAAEELLYADRFLVASNYTKDTLVNNGASKESIFICRYGINQEMRLKPKKIASKKDDKFTAIYIGNVSYQKGIGFLLSALEECKEIIADCFLIGSWLQAPELVRQYRTKYTFTGYISHDKVYEICKKVDFGVFPSLSDGFGFAVAECLSWGLPVICSSNAGASDLIIDGYNGFIVQAGNSQLIADRMRWIHCHPTEFALMRKNAIKSVSFYTWGSYYNSVFKSTHLSRKEITYE